MSVATVPAHTHTRTPWLAPRLKRLCSLAGLVPLALAWVVAPHKASLKRLADIPLTVAGIGCVDFAAFHIGRGWGWLVTGLLLVVLEHLIADPDSS